MRRSCLALLEQFAFQACSFNHSDISHFRINDLRVGFRGLSGTTAGRSTKRSSNIIRQNITCGLTLTRGYSTMRRPSVSIVNKE